MTLLESEWTKLRSTRLLVLAAAAAIGLSVLVTTLLGVAMGSREAYCAAPDAACRHPGFDSDTTIVTAGVLGDGVPGAGLSAVMLLGALCLLVEYRHHTIATAFMATPRRWPVLLAKAGVISAAAFVTGGVATILSALAFRLVGGRAAAGIDPWSADAVDIYLRTALVAAVAALFALGLAAIIRNVLVTAAVVVLWPALFETLLPSLLPGVGEQIAGFLPFVNARNFVGMQDGITLPWGQLGSGIYFLLVVLALLTAGMAVVRRADVR
ncbi:MAG: hypothetical protein ABWZ98_17090 [Nakamurella sp.]